MKNTFGNHLSLTLFGESHGEAVGAVLDGMTPGVFVDEAFIASEMQKRRPGGALATGRTEGDRVRILSGVYRGKTTGAPIALLIGNEDARSGDYEAIASLARPGHADYTGFVKSRGCSDVRGGGHFSGRLTAALVAAGAIVRPSLSERGITVATHIARLAGVDDRAFSDFSADAELLNRTDFAVLDPAACEKMKEKIAGAKTEGDSVGGILESVILGLPAGIGEPWFDGLESVISHAVFSIPGVKGVEFGDGFALADLRGSQANDVMRMQGGRVVTETGHMGGIFGGISAGGPIRLRVAVKPTPSVAKEQKTVDYRRGENALLTLSGRHDPSIVPRARAVLDSVLVLTVADLLMAEEARGALGGGGENR